MLSVRMVRSGMGAKTNLKALRRPPRGQACAIDVPESRKEKDP